MAKESPGWVREGALWSYNKPPTRRERVLEGIRERKELEAKWREKLGPKVCPKCSSDSFEEWTIGWFLNEEHYHDPNRKTCGDCGHIWWIVCPTCGHNKDRCE